MRKLIGVKQLIDLKISCCCHKFLEEWVSVENQALVLGMFLFSQLPFLEVFSLTQQVFEHVLRVRH